MDAFFFPFGGVDLQGHFAHTHTKGNNDDYLFVHINTSPHDATSWRPLLVPSFKLQSTGRGWVEIPSKFFACCSERNSLAQGYKTPGLFSYFMHTETFTNSIGQKKTRLFQISSSFIAWMDH